NHGSSSAFPWSESYRMIYQPRPEERALARVSKDGHTRVRARCHPSRRPREERGLLRMRSEGVNAIVRYDWFHGNDPSVEPLIRSHGRACPGHPGRIRAFATVLCKYGCHPVNKKLQLADAAHRNSDTRAEPARLRPEVSARVWRTLRRGLR